MRRQEILLSFPVLLSLCQRFHLTVGEKTPVGEGMFLSLMETLSWTLESWLCKGVMQQVNRPG